MSQVIVNFERGSYLVSTDPTRLDEDTIAGFLSTSYWAAGRSRERIRTSLRGSLCFGVYAGHEQVGFARVVTDWVTIAYLADVFICEEHRGAGLGRWLLECVFSLPELRQVRRFMLGTRDAHGLYAKFGFVAPDGRVVMERLNHEAPI